MGTETKVVIFKRNADMRRIRCGMVCGMSYIFRSKKVSRYPSLGFEYLLAKLGSRSAPLCVVGIMGKFSPPAIVSDILIVSYHKQDSYFFGALSPMACVMRR